MNSCFLVPFNYPGKDLYLKRSLSGCLVPRPTPLRPALPCVLINRQETFLPFYLKTQNTRVFIPAPFSTKLNFFRQPTLVLVSLGSSSLSRTVEPLFTCRCTGSYSFSVNHVSQTNLGGGHPPSRGRVARTGGRLCLGIRSWSPYRCLLYCPRRYTGGVRNPVVPSGVEVRVHTQPES